MGKKQKLMVLCSVVLFMTSIAGAETYTMIFNTSDNQFDPGVDNQGWWSDTSSNEFITDNYFTGFSINGEHRSYFSFDLSLLSQEVISASLELRRFNCFSSEEQETLGLFDVSTTAAILNNKNGVNALIYEDLGTGTSYGEFEISVDGLSTDILSFDLNDSFIADINNAAGGWLSVGGRLLTPGSPSGGGEGVFGNSHIEDGVQRLVVEVIPEPLTLFLFGVGGLALVRRRIF